MQPVQKKVVPFYWSRADFICYNTEEKMEIFAYVSVHLFFILTII